MEKAIESAMKLLAEKITKDIKADEALKFTQAALNLQHVLAVKANIEIDRQRVKLSKQITE